MRLRNLAFTIAVCLAVAASASAISLPLYNGPVSMNLQAYDMGTLYNLPSDGTFGTPGTGSTVLDVMPQVNGFSANAPKLTDGSVSNTWGIIRLMNITATGNDPAHGIISGTVLWQNTPTDQVDGVFYGLDDQVVTQTTNGALVTQNIAGTGMQVALFENNGGWPGNTTGPAGSTPVTNSLGNSMTYAGITNGAPILTFNAVPGFQLTDLADSFFGSFTTNAATFTSVGDFNANKGAVSYWGTGTQNNLIQRDIPNYQAGDTQGNPSGLVDATFHFTSTNTNGQAGNWLLYVSDPIQSDINSAVPEPVTMAGLAMGLVGLGSYVRRRKAAK
jgi:hypothetical protein